MEAMRVSELGITVVPPNEDPIVLFGKRLPRYI
jgi:hypothetical protein